MQSYIFHRPHNVKVEKEYFDTLHIDLKDVHDQKFPFQFGTSSIKLHIKRKILFQKEQLGFTLP